MLSQGLTEASQGMSSFGSKLQVEDAAVGPRAQLEGADQPAVQVERLQGDEMRRVTCGPGIRVRARLEFPAFEGLHSIPGLFSLGKVPRPLEWARVFVGAVVCSNVA